MQLENNVYWLAENPAPEYIASLKSKPASQHVFLVLPPPPFFVSPDPCETWELTLLRTIFQLNLQLVSLDRHFVLVASSAREKQTWCDALAQCLLKVEYREAAAPQPEDGSLSQLGGNLFKTDPSGKKWTRR